MGTRGLVRVIEGGEVRVAQYGQWDHYPEGQGLTVLKFLRSPHALDRLREGLRHVYVITPEGIEALYTALGIDTKRNDGFITFDDSAKFAKAYPSLHRDTGADILDLITSATAERQLPIKLSTSFADDKLFCEGIFEIDLDAMIFRTYGYSEEPVLVSLTEEPPSDEQYVKLFVRGEDDE